MKPTRRLRSPLYSLLLFVCLLLLLPSSNRLSAQDDEYQEWLKKQELEYGDFEEQQDKEFLEFLKKEWKLTDLEPAKPLYAKPKPDVAPAFRKGPPPAEPKVSGKPVIVPKPVPPVSTKPPVPTPPAQPQAEKFTSTARLSFFGIAIEMRHAPLKAKLGTPLSEQSIHDFWKSLNDSHNEVLVEQSLWWKKEMRLNDWGYCLLLKRAADELFPKKENESVLLTWYLLMKSGYDARVGFNGGRAYLLIPATTSLFGLPYFSFTGSSHRYYALNLATDPGQLPGSVSTYEGTYPGASKLFDFSLKTLPRLGSRPVPRKIRFTFEQEIRSISVTVDQNLADFLRQYPQTPFDVYFNAPVSAATAHDLVEGLTPLVKGKSEVEAVNILLRFVQTAFKYKTDQENFGREKPLFVDETLVYDASDCEDRAVLFSFLVKSLTGLPVVGLNYPGHMATGVKFSTDAGGDAVRVEGVRYTVCDPTFVFADAGRTMDEFRGKEPRVIAGK
ncbi:MAG: hypothetical protein H6Q30_1079 [Bacteroidetes bacterium]|nr:hypothetical protein [Bacteroidota bacterium]